MPPNSRIPREKSLRLTRCFKSNCWLLQTHQVFSSLFPLTQSVMVPLALYHLLYSTRVTYGNQCFSISHPMLSNHFPKEAQYINRLQISWEFYLLSRFKQRSCPYFLFSLFFWKISGTIWFIFFQLFFIFFHSMLLHFLYYQINDSTFLYILQIFLCFIHNIILLLLYFGRIIFVQLLWQHYP